MGGDSGDTEKVEFFKNPNERVIIARRSSSRMCAQSAEDDRAMRLGRPPDRVQPGQPLERQRAAFARTAWLPCAGQPRFGFMDAERAANGR
jgi:hypothetical protein